MKLRLLMALSIASVAIQAMEQNHADSALHRAAKVGDYPTCLALLAEPTWLTGALAQEAQFPQDAIAILQNNGNKEAKGFEGQPADFMAAMQKMSKFTMNLQKFLQSQLELAKKQKTALNDQHCTPFECASQGKAPEQLLALLDPSNNQVITQAVMSILIKKLGAEGKIGIGAPTMASPNAPQANPNGPLFKAGDKIKIDGKEYVCTEAKKIN